jgi:hypothetical protein
VRAYFFFGSLAPTIPNICPDPFTSLNLGFSDASREYFSRTVSLLSVAAFFGAISDVGGFADLDCDFRVRTFARSYPKKRTSDL